MISAAFALLFAAFAVLASYTFQLAQKRARSRRFRGLHQVELKPNCLLTRYPIVFLSGPKTLFRLFDHWNDIPLYLREHGYEVYVIEPSGRLVSDRTASIEAALNDLGMHCHLIADGSLEADLEAIAGMKLAHAASLTLVQTRQRERYRQTRRAPSVQDLKPLTLAIEVFHVEAPADFTLNAWSSHLKLVLLAAHNFLIRRRTRFVHPFETAELSTPASGFKFEARFLDLAISLAERDLVGSD